MTTPPYELHEVFVTDTVLLSFDGRVLEVFGYTDTHRTHLFQEPRLEFGTGRRPRMEITTASGARHSMPYDPHRLDALRAFAARLARAVAERPKH